jgi:hypothetical protein
MAEAGVSGNGNNHGFSGFNRKLRDYLATAHCGDVTHAIFLFSSALKH